MIAVATVFLLFSASLVTPGSEPSQQSLLRQVVPNPTGQNGYEEYLMACDIVRSADIAPLMTGSPAHFEQVIKEYEAEVNPNLKGEELELSKLSRPSAKEYEAAKKYRTFTVLQLRREAVAKAGRALDLVAKGNRKQVYDPRTTVNLETLFPEYAYMRSLSRLAVAGAYVAYADGQPTRATQYLCDAIILGQNLSDGVLIARLVGVGIQSTVFAAIERFLPNLSAADAAMLENLAPKLLTDPPAAVKTLQKEFKFIEESMEKLLDSKDSFTETFGQEDLTVSAKTAGEYMKKVTSAELQQVIGMVKKKMARHKETLLAGYRRPEAAWDQIDDSEEEFDEDKPVRNLTDLADYLGGQLTPVFAQMGSAELRNRTQIRLVAIAGAIIRFRWEHDRWPMKLSEAVGRNGVFDPASGEEFIFETEGSGFKIYSKGSKTTGEIGLRYRRQQTGENTAPPPQW